MSSLDRYYTKHFGGNWTPQEVYDETKKLCGYLSFERVDLRMGDIWWLMDNVRLNFQAAAKVCLDQMPGFTQELNAKDFRLGWYMACSRASQEKLKEFTKGLYPEGTSKNI